MKLNDLIDLMMKNQEIIIDLWTQTQPLQRLYRGPKSNNKALNYIIKQELSIRYIYSIDDTLVIKVER
jgi:hypothetical protein